MSIFKFWFYATDANGKTVRFDVNEPNGQHASLYAHDRAVKICLAQGWTDLRYSKQQQETR